MYSKVESSHPPRCSGALLQPHSFANRAIRARSEAHWVWQHSLCFARFEKVRHAQPSSAPEVEGPSRGAELQPPRSRRNLCVNREVTRLQSDQAMNDKCLDLQKSETKDGAQAGCPYLRGDSQQTFREHALVRVHPPYDKTRPPLTSCSCACFRPRCTTLRSLAAWGSVSERARTMGPARLRAWPR